MNIIEKIRFAYTWRKRNLKHSEVMLKTLEIPYESFYQYIFVEESHELHSKLERLGFRQLSEVSDVVHRYTHAMYNPEYNVVFNLYSPANEHAILDAIEIASRSMVESPLKVLFAAMRVLLSKETKTPQLLME